VAAAACRPLPSARARRGYSFSSAARPRATRTTRAASMRPASGGACARRERCGGRHLVGREAAAAFGLVASARARFGSSRSSAARPCASRTTRAASSGFLRRPCALRSVRRPASRGATGRRRRRRCAAPGVLRPEGLMLGDRAVERVARDAGTDYTAVSCLSPRTPRAAWRPSSRGASGRRRRLTSGLCARAAGHLAPRPRGSARRSRRGRRLHGRLSALPARAESGAVACNSWGE
jgi:hypothetical protein